MRWSDRPVTQSYMHTLTEIKPSKPCPDIIFFRSCNFIIIFNLPKLMMTFLDFAPQIAANTKVLERPKNRSKPFYFEIFEKYYRERSWLCRRLTLEILR